MKNLCPTSNYQNIDQINFYRVLVFVLLLITLTSCVDEYNERTQSKSKNIEPAYSYYVRAEGKKISANFADVRAAAFKEVLKLANKHGYIGKVTFYGIQSFGGITGKDNIYDAKESYFGDYEYVHPWYETAVFFHRKGKALTFNPADRNLSYNIYSTSEILKEQKKHEALADYYRAKEKLEVK